jgi:hypothetical protein
MRSAEASSVSSEALAETAEKTVNNSAIDNARIVLDL